MKHTEEMNDYVDPEDKKELLIFDRGRFTQAIMKSTMERDMVALKEKPEFREGKPEII